MKAALWAVGQLSERVSSLCSEEYNGRKNVAHLLEPLPVSDAGETKDKRVYCVILVFNLGLPLSHLPHH